jgi:hypothetical protein
VSFELCLIEINFKISFLQNLICSNSLSCYDDRLIDQTKNTQS